jgi:hypothetical protein
MRHRTPEPANHSRHRPVMDHHRSRRRPARRDYLLHSPRHFCVTGGGMREAGWDSRNSSLQPPRPSPFGGKCSQTPKTKLQTPTNIQISNFKTDRSVWAFFGVWSLVFGVWSFDRQGMTELKEENHARRGPSGRAQDGAWVGAWELEFLWMFEVGI